MIPQTISSSLANMSIFTLLVVGVVAFYVIKTVLKSIIKGLLYSALIVIVLFFFGLVYFFGLAGAITLIRGVFNI